MKSLRILFLFMSLTFVTPQAKAIDPVTMAILAPIVAKLADAARPYVIRAAVNSGKCIYYMGKDAFEILYLPYGMGKFLFGRFHSGCVYMLRGLIAPCKLVFHTLLLPLFMIGINVNA